MPDAGLPTDERRTTWRVSSSAIGARLIERVRDAGPDGVVFIARSESQAEEVSICCKAFMPESQVILLPPWDCLPYDRIQPSRESMGRRVAALVAMAEPAFSPARLVVTSPEAALQRIAPVKAMATAFITLSAGEPFDIDALSDRLLSLGYLLDDRVDEAGEFSLLGQGLDVYPPGAPNPYRVFIEDGVVSSIRSYDPVTQRTLEPAQTIEIVPATELMAANMEADLADVSSIESRILSADVELASIFALSPRASIIVGPGVDDRFDAAITLIDEARHARDKQRGRKPTAERFYLDRRALNAELKPRRTDLETAGLTSAPDFIGEPNPSRAAAAFADEMAQAGLRVVLAGAAADVDRLARTVGRTLSREIEEAARWPDILNGEPGSVVRFAADIEDGFIDQTAALAVLAGANVFGTRFNASTRTRTGLIEEPDLRVGDVILHEDHGLGVLRALETLELDGKVAEAVRLEYHGGASLLAPVDEFGRIWRYGAEADAVSLDKLKGDGWAKRRAQLDVEIDETADHLVRLAKEREKNGARVLTPPRAAYARFAARFPYPETVDQSAAIAAVLEDLSSGKAMNRLVCGDVGFGKTEVALRAAAVVALNGGQVAVAAPTTVLARQHFETFSRRFEGTDVTVALLSRTVGAAEAEAVRASLADGSTRIVIGTQAIAAQDVTFADLALLVIDEEHRFGVRVKQELRGLAPRLHVLSMSATPIPRTLAAAMVGVQEASLLTTPPARRRPVRTELSPFDTVLIKTALIRERRRSGQSFCVVPRIADIEATATELRNLVPDLSLLIAHGELKPAAMDDAMVRFANGEGDILLSTNIIENGLDVPRANTIIVIRADRFGLAQLHQLRGRVGRGRAQGSAYLLTEPGKEIAPETRARLSTLLALDRLGSGLPISVRDLDLRGAGDLVGEDQAGHMKLIGLGLYQRLLARAVKKARGDDRSISEPEIDLEISGAFPSDYVPDATVRLNLYSRLQRIERAAEIDAFADELEDRFGAPPPETMLLFELARLKQAAAGAGIVRIGAGPAAIAIEFAQPDSKLLARLQKYPDCTPGEERVIFKIATTPGPGRLRATRKLVDFCRAATT
ncbi:MULTISPECIES: DEAD/DEAH box helicase [unclassified Mesorhizobium]|uniref:DEAD/DEAH box helicase n=2 Tax=Mesorhizobium TaxID=68287 RepID=UPI001676AB5D|nr:MULTISPECIES: DEAD/DEAH box helicase [unclassified Mesorhizobium]